MSPKHSASSPHGWRRWLAEMDVGSEYAEKFLAVNRQQVVIYCTRARTWAGYLQRSNSEVRKVGGTAPWGAVGLTRWALIGTRGGRERCYYHRGALVDK
jgi:hypothetical protein